jgi:hypothetical protein
MSGKANKRRIEIRACQNVFLINQGFFLPENNMRPTTVTKHMTLYNVRSVLVIQSCPFFFFQIQTYDFGTKPLGGTKLSVYPNDPVTLCTLFKDAF